jgi:WD40 repeat protein
MNGSKRFLISTGTGAYDNLPPDQQRLNLEQVVQDLTQLFTHDLGYNRVLEKEIGFNPTSETLKETLDEWFGSSDRKNEDWVVLYYTGHGELAGASTLYLLTRNFKIGRHASTAFPLNILGDMFTSTDEVGENRRVKNFLLILDTCFSGAGVIELAPKFNSIFSQGINDCVFYILAASFPNEEAMSGALATAITEALSKKSIGGSHQQFIYFDQLIPAINKKLKYQQVIFSSFGSPKEEPQFFPNPHYVPGLPLSIPVSDIKYGITVDEFINYWSPNSRGVEFEHDLGNYFTGRKKIINDLTDWLNNPNDHRARIITGKAGVGKSAILSRIIMISNTTISEDIIDKYRNINDSNFKHVDLAIHSKGKKLEDFIDRISTFLNIETTKAEIMEVLNKRDQPFFFIIDALDEAVEPQRIATALLEPLSGISSVKLLIGTRPEYLNDLGDKCVHLFVDDPQYLERSDFEDYVTSRLLCVGDLERITPYRKNNILARQVANVITKTAYPNFLIGRLISEALISSSRIIKPDEINDSGLPNTVAKAFNDYLRRFDEEETKVRDILTPLAWSYGMGLPFDNIWPRLASALSGNTYEDEDITWVLNHAGSFIIESIDQKRSVFRLYHQALSDYFREGRDDESIHKIIFLELINSIPKVINTQVIDWKLASPYILNYLSVYAQKSGNLNDLLLDPYFLLLSNSSQLFTDINSVGNTIPRELVYRYQQVVHHIRSKPLNESSSYLMMSSFQNGVLIDEDYRKFYSSICEWETIWTKWHPETPSMLLGNGDSYVSVFTCAKWLSRMVAIIGRTNGYVEVWDISDGKKIANWNPNLSTSVDQLSFIDIQGKALIVASWDDNHIGVYNLREQTSVLKTLNSRILALCVTKREGKFVFVTAEKDLSLKIWSLPEFEIIIDKKNATLSNVYSLSEINIGFKTFVLSAGDSLAKKSDTRVSTLNLWSLNDLENVWKSESVEKGVFTNAETFDLFENEVTVISQDNWGPTQLWDIKKGKFLLETKETATCSWIIYYNAQPILLSINLGGLVAERLIRNVETNEILLSTRLHTEEIPWSSAADYKLIELNERPVILGRIKDSLRIWKVDDILNTDFLINKTNIYFNDAVLSIVANISSGFCYAGLYDTFMKVDIPSGESIHKFVIEEMGRRFQVSILEDRFLVAATAGGSIWTLNLEEQNAPFSLLLIQHDIEKVCLLRGLDRYLLLGTVKIGGNWYVNIWDLISGEELPTDSAYGLTSGEGDKPLHGLTAIALEKKIRIAFASKYGKIMVADYDGSVPVRYDAFDEWHVPYSNGEYIECLSSGKIEEWYALGAGTEHGHIAVWNFETGEEHSSLAQAHIGKVTVIKFFTINGNTILVSGGEDGMMQLWSVSLDLILKIEIGVVINDFTYCGDQRIAVATSRGIIMIKVKNIDYNNS